MLIALAQEDERIKLILAPENLVKEIIIGDYIYRNYVGPPYDFDVFQIYKGEELVYQSDIGYEYWLGKEEGLFQPGDDITGDGIPNLVVMESSGGNSFAFSCTVFSLGEKFRLIQGLPRGDFVDINQDGKLECIAYQQGFTFWHACHALSPAPKLIYEYVNDKYLLAPALMYQPLPDKEEINRTIEDLKRSCVEVEEKKWDDADGWNYGNVCIFSPVWSYMLDLMFAGHPHEAYDFLNEVWPKGEKGKYNFLYDFEKILNEHTNWPALKPLFARIAEVKKENPSASIEEKITQGVIRIWASPENTKVYFDNEYLGETPLFTDLLVSGKYNIRLSHLGYYDTEMTVEAVPLHVQKLEGVLKQKEGNSTLFISSNPEKAEVFLDSTYVGLTPLRIKKITPENHELTLIKYGYQFYKEYIEIYPGEDHEISADLHAEVQEKTLFKEFPFIEKEILLFVLIVFSLFIIFKYD